VWTILHRAGVDPAPVRSALTWRQLLRAQAKGVLTVDFLHHRHGVPQAAVRAVRDRGGHPPGPRARVTPHPVGEWVAQQARNPLMQVGQDVAGSRFLVRDRDTKFTAGFDTIFAAAGIEVLRTPVRRHRQVVVCGDVAARRGVCGGCSRGERRDQPDWPSRQECCACPMPGQRELLVGSGFPASGGLELFVAQEVPIISTAIRLSADEVGTNQRVPWVIRVLQASPLPLANRRSGTTALPSPNPRPTQAATR
jgi:hypothetical protein